MVKDVTAQPQATSERLSATPDGDYGQLNTSASSLPGVTIVDESQETARKPTKKPYQRKVGVRLGVGGMVGHTRNQRLLKIVEKAGGAYPGDRELYYAFATDITKDEADATTDWPTIKRAIKQLVDAKKLTKITFVFADPNGVTTKKQILLLPGIKAGSEHVRRLQRCMVAAHPQYYFPEGVEIKRVYTQRLSERRGVDSPTMQPKTVVERDGLLPAWAPIPARAPVTQEPAWKQWAKAEKVGGNLAQASQARIDSDEEAYTEEPDEQQLGMQAHFQLDTYAHNTTAVPQNLCQGVANTLLGRHGFRSTKSEQIKLAWQENDEK